MVSCCGAIPWNIERKVNEKKQDAIKNPKNNGQSHLLKDVSEAGKSKLSTNCRLKGAFVIHEQ